MSKSPFHHMQTLCVHAGAKPEEQTGAVMYPIFQTSTYVQSAPGEHKGFDYSRGTNPTRAVYEEALAQLEKATYALSFASGLAVEQAIIQTLLPGQRVLVCEDVYGGTGRLFRKLYAHYGITFDFIDFENEELLTEHAKKAPVHMIWMETPSNPTMKIISIKKMSQLAQSLGAILVVDNTFASPIFQNPLALGAHVVVHSTTKYIGGHSDLIGGAVMLHDAALFEKLRFIQFAGGAVPGPFDCFLFLRSIKTLALRMEQHQKNGRMVSAFLKKHPKIKKLYDPGSEDHPGHHIAKEQMSGFSGMMSFEWDGSYEEVVKITQSLRLFSLAESLGGVESLINHPERMTHASVPEDLRKKLGIGPTMLRLSLGIEHGQDLVSDLEQAFLCCLKH